MHEYSWLCANSFCSLFKYCLLQIQTINAKHKNQIHSFRFYLLEFHFTMFKYIHCCFSSRLENCFSWFLITRQMICVACYVDTRGDANDYDWTIVFQYNRNLYPNVPVRLNPFFFAFDFHFTHINNNIHVKKKFILQLIRRNFTFNSILMSRFSVHTDKKKTYQTHLTIMADGLHCTQTHHLCEPVRKFNEINFDVKMNLLQLQNRDTIK